jgi:hypothetical protein
MAENTFLQLKHYDLAKRGFARVPVFVDKVKDKEYFSTDKGAVIITSPTWKVLDASMRVNGYSAMMKGKTDKGKAVTVKYPHEFHKTPEFGGKGKGSGTAAEDRELSGLRKEIERAMVKNGISVLPMIVGKKKCMVVGVESTFGTPKSDFHLVDAKGEAVAWISHKDGSTAKDFQQYGGLADKIFKNNKEVTSWMNALKKQFPDGMKSGDTAWRNVRSTTLIKQSVWGIDYGKDRGKNNVDEFHQGPMKIKKRGRNYIIQSKHQDNNGALPKGDYKAIFYARYTGDRGANAGGVTVGTARVGVFAIAIKKKNVEEI